MFYRFPCRIDDEKVYVLGESPYYGARGRHVPHESVRTLAPIVVLFRISAVYHALDLVAKTNICDEDDNDER
jgi:hypothetical protein